MPTLSQASKFSKKTFIKIVIAASILLAIFLIWTVGKSIKNSLIPPKPLPATVAFGKLPKLDLSEGIRPSLNTTYKIETISGQLPQLALRAKVFALAGEESSFGALARTKITVSKIGFNAQEQNLDLHLVKFTDPKQDGRTITINTASGNFEYTSNFTQDTQVISSRPKSVEDAKQAAVSFLNNFDFDLREFPIEKVETRTLRIDGNRLTETPALVNANLVEVNFKRLDIDKIPVISPRESSPSAQALVSSNKVVTATLVRQTIEKHNFATYPLKGTAKAFEELKAGYAAFNKNPQDLERFPIRDVALAYLETRNSQGFLMPVYVFKSDKGLVAYVPAIDETWTK